LGLVFGYTGCGFELQLIAERGILRKVSNGFNETSLRKGVNTEVEVRFLRKVLQQVF
jgi:hypothetical protein